MTFSIFSFPTTPWAKISERFLSITGNLGMLFKFWNSKLKKQRNVTFYPPGFKWWNSIYSWTRYFDSKFVWFLRLVLFADVTKWLRVEKNKTYIFWISCPEVNGVPGLVALRMDSSVLFKIKTKQSQKLLVRVKNNSQRPIWKSYTFRSLHRTPPLMLFTSCTMSMKKQKSHKKRFEYHL